MYKFLIRNGQTAAVLLGIAVIVIFLVTVFTGFGSSPYGMSTDLNALSPEEKAGIGFFNTGLGLTVILTILAFGLAFIVFGILDLVRFPKSAMKFIIGLVVLGIIFFALYSMSDVEMMGRIGKVHKEFNITDGVSKFISAGIKTTIGLVVLSALAMVFGELRNAFK